jgi:hypothetical protein
MISIKRYLTNNPSEIEEVFRRVIQILLNAIEIHATQDGDEVDYADFKRTFHGIAGQFSDQTPAKEALVMAGSAAATLREYGKQTTKYIRAQNAEYHRILTMLTDAIVGISQGSERSTTRLREIEHQLERAAVIDDVRTLRVRLGECLTSIQEECEHQAREAAAMTARLTQSIAESETRVQVASPCPEEDPVTRLPGISAAERAITKLIATVPHAYVVGVIPSNIQAINSRFGHAVGDHVLQQIREELQTSLCTVSLRQACMKSADHSC